MKQHSLTSGISSIWAATISEISTDAFVGAAFDSSDNTAEIVVACSTEEVEFPNFTSFNSSRSQDFGFSLFDEYMVEALLKKSSHQAFAVLLITLE